MKLNICIFALLANLALASAADHSPGQDEALNMFEKRKGCSGNRLSTDVCTGKRQAGKVSSFHNWDKAERIADIASPDTARANKLVRVVWEYSRWSEEVSGELRIWTEKMGRQGSWRDFYLSSYGFRR
ncbi:hypothetical protein AJ80_00563 [Polytolypa hystricis UAMH7299]|uniref:Uncharacterized protein n=1 Tax=Polytolypa hystricis (strain UAMH7299) TaxID=1447883 RepID=A0A2B7Z2D6_POLH7|nr:hypothetical protein AJ80_00563 [Polytolypa hystricis UAMH7299]